MMVSKLNGDSTYEDIDKGGKVGELLKLIQKISKEVNPNASTYDSIDEAKSRYYLYRQLPEDSNEAHTKNFKSLVEHVEHSGGYLYRDKMLVEHEKDLDKAAGVDVSKNERRRLLSKNQGESNGHGVNQTLGPVKVQTIDNRHT